MMVDHYRTLGVAPNATPDDIRRAYRELARRYHPDRAPAGSGERMADVNAAWHVLSDPGRRAVYDAARTQRVAGGAPEPVATGSSGTPPVLLPPAVFPWRGVVIAGVVACIVVVVLSILRGPPTEIPVDNVIEAGSCVVIEQNGDAREVSCSADHDGIVERLVPFDARCPADTSTHRDRQGMGLACVRSTVPAGVPVVD
jgi:molecular chaperone DnaJ